MNVDLQTKRLNLQSYQLEQALRVSELAGDRDIARTTAVPHPYTPEIAEEWIQMHPEWINQGIAYPLAMNLKTSDELVGTMTLRVDGNNNKGELAYWVGKPYWGRGFASEAAQRMVEFGFEELQLQRIWAPAISTNQASAKVLQNAGLTYEGTLKQDLYQWGEYVDLDVYGIVMSGYYKVSRGT